ncbi:MAG: PilZ domain-containing protein [Planctomycetes bacterium]|nr:PilZ domain-containing protein [Planctomycetota bacterium]
MVNRDTQAAGKRGAERRRYPRADSDLPITILLDGKHYEARVRDVSRAGVCFYLERSIPLMTVLALDFPLRVGGASHRVRGQGAVVRCEKISPTLQHFECAVFLHDASETDREVIDAYVASRATV